MKYEDLKTRKWFHTAPLNQDILGTKILELTQYAGSYGMGGPGYVALKLSNKSWLIFGLWGAVNWIHYNWNGEHVILSDHLKEYGPKFTYEPPYNGPLICEIIKDFSITDNEFLMNFESGKELCIFADSNTRPVFPGTGQNRKLKEGESLVNLIFTHSSPSISVLE